MQKRVWKEVASNFHEKGYNITDEQCSTKWKNLKQKYKHVRDNNNETGRAAQTWEYFDMIDEFLHTRPEILPVSVASSTHGFRVREKSLCTDYEERNDENDPAVSNTSYGVIRNVRKRQKCDSSALLEQLYKQREDHHKNNIEMQKKFLTLFANYMKNGKKE
ncbi:PREDICTED: trihelix transcription factor GT-3a-like [Trachymyrmex cornetzi]|uniref:trihelix transcription factor GT-3a-like n=1 Tax=Trachymyrmex cornetzi TaxID=471704 RepID=UPI00084F4B7E|nr:PREDICTED: trihelix transcription factor GT-3a-like [Trachymyrmex cornetzi]